jgi:hypothetical protein
MLSAIVFTLQVMAADTTYDYVFSNKEKNIQLNYYGALTFQHFSVVSNTMPGIEGGIVFNKKLFAGVYGHGTTGNFGMSYGGTIHNIMSGEGGLFVGYIGQFPKPIHMGGMLKTGYISLVADDKEMKLFKKVDSVAKDGGMVFHPELFAEANITKQLKIRLGLGYSFHSLDKESVAYNCQLDSWTMNLGILFGNFYK